MDYLRLDCELFSQTTLHSNTFYPFSYHTLLFYFLESEREIFEIGQVPCQPRRFWDSDNTDASTLHLLLLTMGRKLVPSFEAHCIHCDWEVSHALELRHL